MGEIFQLVDQKFKFPGADGALVPLNMHRWGAYAAGAVTDRLLAVHENVEAAKSFLEYAPSDIVWNDRFAILLEDTLKVNFLAEFGGDAGAVLGGIYAKIRADKYMDILANEALSNSVEGAFRLEVLRRAAAEAGKNPTNIVGVGLLKQNLPKAERSPFLGGPYSPGQSPLWHNITRGGLGPLGFIRITPYVLRIPRVSGVLVKHVGLKAYKYSYLTICLYIYLIYIIRYINVGKALVVKHQMKKRCSKLIKSKIKRFKSNRASYSQSSLFYNVQSSK